MAGNDPTQRRNSLSASGHCVDSGRITAWCGRSIPGYSTRGEGLDLFLSPADPSTVLITCQGPRTKVPQYFVAGKNQYSAFAVVTKPQVSCPTAARSAPEGCVSARCVACASRWCCCRQASLRLRPPAPTRAT
eukprot:3097426-Prymnesium_polylepis.3